MNQAEQMREALRREFPLLDEIGLDQELHHCEWSIQQERKRLHQLLDELQAEQALAAEPTPLVRLNDGALVKIYLECKAEWKATNKRQRQRIAVMFGNAIMTAMERANQ